MPENNDSTQSLDENNCSNSDVENVSTTHDDYYCTTERFNKIEQMVLDVCKNIPSLQKAIDQENSVLEGLQTDSELKYKQLSNSFTNIKAQTQTTFKKMNEVSRQVATAQTKNMEIMGVFVALFTFISVSTTTLLNFQNVYIALFFLSVFLFCLVSFLVIFHFILNNSLKKCGWILSISIPFTLSIVFGFSYYKSSCVNKQDINDKKETYQTNTAVSILNISTNTVTISTQTKSLH